MPIRRNYLTLDSGRQVHYLRCGSGNPVVLLHPSPLSATFLTPLIDFLSPGFDLVAMDTPGYGNSDPLPGVAAGLEGYTKIIAEVLEKLDLGCAVIYGNATGAQLAIETAKQSPAQVRALVLENAASFSDRERAELLPQYFPDLSPDPEGEHLARAWRMAGQLYSFFPWYDTSEAARLSADTAPLEVIQATVQGYLAAGPDYDRAYRAAFANERPEQLASVAQPTEILLWSGSMLLEYSRRLQAAGMPPNVCFTEVSAGIEARYQAVKTALEKAWEKS